MAGYWDRARARGLTMDDLTRKRVHGALDELVATHGTLEDVLARARLPQDAPEVVRAREIVRQLGDAINRTWDALLDGEERLDPCGLITGKWQEG
jgi:hypothetical protein